MATVKPQKVQFDRSLTPTNVPEDGSLKEGGLGINLIDRIIYSQMPDGEIVKVAGNYDDILMSHFATKNPHGLTLEDLDGPPVLTAKEFEPLVYVNPDSFTLATRKLFTYLEYSSRNSVQYTIDSSKYLIGDEINISRYTNTAGTIDVYLDGANYMVRGNEVNDYIQIRGWFSSMVKIKKISETLWMVHALRV